MAKMIPLHQIIEIEKVFRDVRIGGVVTKSNFLEIGERHIFPIHDKVASLVETGQQLKITFFSMEDDVHEIEGGMKFISKGVKYETWNEENEGWDCIWEQMHPQV